MRLALVWGKDAHVFRPERFIDTDDYKWPRDGCTALLSLVNFLLPNCYFNSPTLLGGSERLPRHSLRYC